MRRLQRGVIRFERPPVSAPTMRPILHCDRPPNRLQHVAQFATVIVAQFSTVTDSPVGKKHSTSPGAKVDVNAKDAM